MRVRPRIAIDLRYCGYSQVAEIPLSIIVIESQDKAEHVLGELKAGADFAALAKAESVDPTASNGGSLGLVSPDGLRTELRDAIQRLAPGQYSGVVRIPSGYAILKIDTKAADPAPPTPGHRKKPHPPTPRTEARMEWTESASPYPDRAL